MCLLRHTPDEVAKLLTKMSLKTQVKGDNLVVKIPPTRHDVIHTCDIYEDVAIGYGYNRIKKTIPKTATVGKEVSFSMLVFNLKI